MIGKNALSPTLISMPLFGQDTLIVDWQLVESCNYACEYCHLENPNKQEIFSRSRILAIARRVFELGRPAYLFRITGGEPTLHPYFPELLRFLFHAGRKVRLIFDTNGSREPKYYQSLLYSAPPASVRVDLSVHVGKTSPEQAQRVIEAVVAAGQGCHVQFVYNPELADKARHFHAVLTALRASLPFTLEISCLVQEESGFRDNTYTARDRAWLAEAEKTFAGEAERAAVIAPDYDWLRENAIEATSFTEGYLCVGATYLRIDARGLIDGGVSLSGEPDRRIDAASDNFGELEEVVESAKVFVDEDVLALLPRFRHEQEARTFLTDFRSQAEIWRNNASLVPDPLHPEPTAEKLVSARLQRLDAAYGLSGEKERLSDVAKVYAALADDQSRDVYLRCLRAWQCGDVRCLAPVEPESSAYPAQQGVALSSAQACLDVPLSLLRERGSCRLMARQKGASPAETFMYVLPPLSWEKPAEDSIRPSAPSPVIENRVSVIVPVHNNAETLRRCLDSALAQHIEHLEIIVVDGASTDASLDILAAYQRRYPEIVRVIRLASNRGPGLNRNIGMELATGAGMFFLDSDDALAEHALSRGMKVLQAEQADSVVFDMRLVALDGTQSHVGVEEGVYSGKEALSSLLMEKLGGWSTNNRLYRTTFLREQHIRYSEIVVHHDLLFNIPATFYADKIVVLQEVGYTRYARKNAVSDRDNGKSQVVALAVAVRFLDRFFAEHRLDVSAPSYARCVRRLYALNRSCLFATTRKADRDGEKPPLSNQRLRHLGESREMTRCLLEEGALLTGIHFKNGSHVVLDTALRSWKKDDFSLRSGAGIEQSRSLFHGETAGTNIREGQCPNIVTLESSDIFSEESKWTCIPYGQADAPASVTPIFSFIFPDDGIAPSPEACLKSLFSGFADGFEVIVTSAADDVRVASLMDYADLFANVRLYRLPGASRSVCGRVGLEKARGEYVFFLDEKDRVFPLFLNEACAAVKNSNADVVCFAVREITPDGMLLRYTPLEQSLLDTRQAIKRTLEDETFQSPYGALIRTVLLREAGSAGSDDLILPNAAMWIRVLSHAKVILTHPCIACDRMVTQQPEKTAQRMSHENLRASCSLYAAWQSVADAWSQDEELIALVCQCNVERLREKFLPQLAVFRQALGHIPLTASEYVLLSQAPMFLSNLVLECARLQEPSIPEGLLPQLPAWPSFLFLACAQPVLTVIIPVHNQEKDIAACLQNVQQQSLLALEILIMDNASTDLTATICQNKADRDRRLVVHSMDTQLEEGALCAKALEQARGQYVLFVAPSETLHPNTLLRASVLLARHPLVDVVLCALDNAPDQERFFTREQWLGRICVETEESAWRLTGKVFRRELLCRMVPDFVPGVSEKDESLWRLYATAQGIVYSPEAAYELQALSRFGETEQASSKSIQRLLRLAEIVESLLEEDALSHLHEAFLTTRLFPRLQAALRCLGKDIGANVLPLTTLPIVSLAKCSQLWRLALNDCAALYARQATREKRLALEDADALRTKNGENRLVELSTPSDGTEPRLSIVILARNAVASLSNCLDGILAQGTAELEILVADNASEDATLLLCREYAAGVSCIRCFRTLWKTKEADLRALMLEQVRGAYVLFLAPEHHLDPHFLPNALALLKTYPACGVFVFSHAVLDMFGEQMLAQCNYADEELDMEECLRRVVEAPTEAGLLWNKLFKTSVIRGLEQSFFSDQSSDVLLALHVYAKTNVRTASILATRHPQMAFSDNVSKEDFTEALTLLTGIQSFFPASGTLNSSFQAAECVRACFREGLADAFFDYPSLCEKNGLPSPLLDVAAHLAAFPALTHGLLMLYAALVAGVHIRQRPVLLPFSEWPEPVFVEPAQPKVIPGLAQEGITPQVAPPAELALFDGENLVDKELWNTDPKAATVLALQRSGFFDRNYYLRAYPDVVASGMDPIEHYVCHGAEEGRSPAPWYKGKNFLDIILHKNIKNEFKKITIQDKNSINVVYITDENYALPTSVSLASLKYSIDAGIKVNAYIITNGLSEYSIEKINLLYSKDFNITIINNNNNYIYNIDATHVHVTKTSLFKFFIHKILNHIDKVLYIDSDTVILKSIEKFFNINIDNYFIAAISDMRGIIHGKNNIKLGISNYFNSGIMLMNLKKMRDFNIDEKLIQEKFLEDVPGFMDQTALNKCLHNKTLYTDIKFNLMLDNIIESKYSVNDVNNFYNKQYISFSQMIDECFIFHFANKMKPWIYMDRPYYDIFKKFYNLSPYQKENLIRIKDSIVINDKKINKKSVVLDKENLKELSIIGLTKTKRKKRIIVSLTSYPKRINNIYITLYSLLNQTIKADKIVLWLAEDEFQDKKIPESLLYLSKKGIDINWCKNIKSYKKLIPSLLEFKNDIIVTADDDIFYYKTWLSSLYFSYKKSEKDIHALRVRKIDEKINSKYDIKYNLLKLVKNECASFLNIPTGAGGVLYPPNSLSKDVFFENIFLDIAISADDLWFWAMAVVNNTKIHSVQPNYNELIYTDIQNELSKDTLNYINVKNNENDKQLYAILDKYDLIKKIKSK